VSRGDPDPPAAIVKPTPNSPDELLARQASLAKAAQFLDNAAVTWTRERKCGTCHTNFPYLMTRAALDPKDAPSAGIAEVRRFFEAQVEKWETGKPRSDAEVVATAAVLAFHDAHTTGKLQPLTRKAFDRMWSLQQKDGAWKWIKCNWPPFEHDDYYGAVLAAVGLAHAPENYAKADSAREGVARLQRYFQNTPPPDLHHKAWLMWASLRLDGFMTLQEREQTLKDLRALQRNDGGWSLASLGDWKGFDGRKNNKDAPSDGYATGLAVYLLRQAGVPAADPQVQRGVAWLRSNQRESGRWFTQSLNTDKYHFITNTGTGFAVLALKACE
jgi:squalene-hopene/tetraprenyl-beta-curcumene cyclase